MSLNVTVHVTTKPALARELSQAEALGLVSAAAYEAKKGKGRLLTLMTSLSVGGQAPSRVKLFGFGETSTTKGDFFLSQGSAAKALEYAQGYGNDLVVDLDHRSLWGDSKAVGWFGLSVDEQGLWADLPRFFVPLEGQSSPTGILWTAEGKRLIESYEYRYISPVFWTEYDDQGREVINEIMNFALTNIPATKNRAPLINSRGQENETMPGENTNQSNISVTTKEELLSQVYALTGETEVEKVKGALAALSQIKSQLVAANAALEAERVSHKVTATKLREVNLDNLIKEGKLPPAMRQECLSLSEEALTTTLKFLSGLPTPAAQPQQQQPPTNTTTPEGLTSALSKEELEHCKTYGLDATVYAQTKNTYYKNKSVEL